MNIAVLSGRAGTSALRSDPDVRVLATDDFWTSITGTHDFGGRLLKVSVILAPLIKRRAEAEVTRIKREARALFADKDGDLNLDALANPPKLRRKKRKPTAKQK